MDIRSSATNIEELCTLVAPLFGYQPSDVDDVIVIIRGKCHDCGRHHQMQAITTLTDFSQYVSVLADILQRAYTEPVNVDLSTPEH